jgi:hypothetical protein
VLGGVEIGFSEAPKRVESGGFLSNCVWISVWQHLPPLLLSDDRRCYLVGVDEKTGSVGGFMIANVLHTDLA